MFTDGEDNELRLRTGLTSNCFYSMFCACVAVCGITAAEINRSTGVIFWVKNNCIPKLSLCPLMWNLFMFSEGNFYLHEHLNDLHCYEVDIIMYVHYISK